MGQLNQSESVVNWELRETKDTVGKMLEIGTLTVSKKADVFTAVLKTANETIQGSAKTACESIASVWFNYLRSK